MLVMGMFLVACGSDDESTGTSQNEQDNEQNNEQNNDDEDQAADANEPQEGGSIVFTLDSEFKGILDVNFYDTAVDGDILDFIVDPLITYDENLKIKPNIATWETVDNEHYTFKFKEGVKWHNGEELTVHDWVFAIETIATIGPDHHRYSNINNIVGVQEFTEGTADHISGLEVVNDYEINITFVEPRVNNLENLWTYPMSRTAFEGIAPEDMEGSAPVRTNPVGTGPFKVANIIPGESIELVRHEDYWQGKPNIERVIIKVVDPSLTVGELESGNIDVTPFHPTLLDQISAIENVKVMEQPGLVYYYVGFKLGHWDEEASINVMDNPKYQNKALRQAMIYAIDREKWVDTFFNGLGAVINRPIPTNHWIAADHSDLPNDYPYDPEKAKQLLDEAGYVDVNGDGFREDPDGNEFVVHFGHYATNNPTFEARATAIAQYWEDVGLKVNLTMPDSNLYYDLLDQDDPTLEVFFGGWSTGSDPDPYPLWGTDAFWNLPRYVNEEANQLLLDALDFNVVGTDSDKRKDLYVQWQTIFNEELPVLPIAELNEPWAFSERLQGVSLTVNGLNSAHEWWVKQD